MEFPEVKIWSESLVPSLNEIELWPWVSGQWVNARC